MRGEKIIVESFTGLDVQKAISDIRGFSQSCYRVSLKAEEAIKNLAVALNEKWASPNAVEFSNTYNTKVNDVLNEFATTYLHIKSGAIGAAGTLARANGVDFTYESNVPTNVKAAGKIIFFNCKESLNGGVGMDAEGVRFALDIFKLQTKNFLSELDQIPNGIAFYDPDGNMIGSYNRNVGTFKNEFSDLFDEITNTLTDYLSSEIDNILIAKQQATDILNG